MSQPEPHIDIEGLELLRRDAALLPPELSERRKSLDRHLEICAECSTLMKACQVIINGSSPKGLGPQCPNEEAWLELAAGLHSGSDLNRLLSHAAQCGPCSELLRDALASLTDNTIDPQASQLSSATPAWQAELGTRLAAENPVRKQTAKPSRRFRLLPSTGWLRPASALAAVLLLAIAVGAWYHFHPSIEGQLARAYDARRLTELRIPGADAVAIYSPTRGSAFSHDWPELLSVKLAAEEGLAKNPDSPYWHQVMGKALVLQSDPAGALAQFQAAYARDPSLPGIQFDLGTAYFELGDSTRDPVNYGLAAEAFTLHLGTLRRPNDSVTLFNLALCWSRMAPQDKAFKEKALKGLQQALENERRPDWQQAIRRQIDALNQSPSPVSESPAPDGAVFVGWKSSSIDDHYEDLVERLVAAPPVAALDRTTANNLTDSGQRHGDQWLVDWLSGSRASALADALLAQAVRANRAGEADQALELARRASVLYRGAHNDAGSARAAFEQIYALHRSGRARDCLSAIHDLPSRLWTRYSYLGTMLRLEEASCLEMQGDPQPSRFAILRARSDAAQFEFPGLYARAQGFLAAYSTQQGMPEQGWNDDVIGLRFCASFSCTPMRRYQFVSDLIDDSIALNLNQVAVVLAEANTRIAQSAENLQIEAYAFEVLGQRQLECGLPADASKSFSEADSILIKLGDVPAARAYRVDWSADRAHLLTVQGHDDQALTLINNATRDAASAQSTVLQLNYWSARALLDRAAGRKSDQLESARVATGFAAKVLGGLNDVSDRKAWQSRAELAYVVWVDALLKAGRDQDALDAWEFFSSGGEVGSPSVPDNGPLLQRTSASPGIPRRNRILVYARLIDTYVVFVVEDGGNVSKVLKLPAAADAIDQLARTFSTLCADRNSRLPDVRMAGSSLYAILFPQPDLLGPRLTAQVDGRLRNTPFAAMVRPDGSYLGAHSSVVLLPWLSKENPASGSASFTTATRLVILRGASSAPGADAIPEMYDESAELASRFPRSELLEARSSSEPDMMRSLQSADIVHFTGHAQNRDGAASLLLGDDASLNLSSQSFAGVHLRTCRLAVLAACSTLSVETQSGSIKSGLPEALLQAGVPTIVGTLWDVDSEATKRLMLNFYGQLLKGNSPEIALQRAQAQIGATADLAHPFYWSGFTVMES
jgi:tetratricopeptide (TPR) repeat protein